jgi:hypothetical protein
MRKLKMLVTQNDQVKPGSLIRFNKPGSKRYSYGIVVRVESEDKRLSFYYVKCSRYGSVDFWIGQDAPAAANYVNHSNMLWSCEIRVIRHIQLVNNFGMPGVGIPRIDNYLSLLDGRYQAFRDHAPQEMLDLYDKWEDQNYHEDCGFMVAKWYEEWRISQPFGQAQ